MASLREGHSKSSETQAAAAFVLKINVRASAIARFVAISSAQCCGLPWQNRAMGDGGGCFYTQGCGCCS